MPVLAFPLILGAARVPSQPSPAVMLLPSLLLVGDKNPMPSPLKLIPRTLGKVFLPGESF